MERLSLFSYIKQHLAILDVIGEYVSLRQAGTYWKGPCPFHNEKDASFTVSPDKGIFYCFGCHTGGDVVAFAARAENLQQIEAAHHLIERFKLSVPEDILKQTKSSQGQQEKKQGYNHICQVVAEWAHEQIVLHRSAYDYLLQRGISKAEIDYFTVGYFPGGVRAVTAFIKAMSLQGVLAKDLLEAGILHQGRNIFYSPFEERILFPIKDSQGRFCGFGGRIFKQGDERAKYYNSKESAGFDKGSLLFGLDLAKKEMQKQEIAFLVEGYIDCIAMVKHGYIPTVATLGTACTQEHLKLLARYIKTLYVLYDGDAAGQKAILRLTRLCWCVNLDLRVIRLPVQEDPASFLEKKGDMALLIKNASDIFTFFIDSLGKGFVSKPLADKLVAADHIMGVIVDIDDPIKQDLLLQEAAGVLQVPLELLKKNVKERHRKVRYEGMPQKENESLPAQEDSAEFDIPILEEKILICLINSMTGEQPLHIDEELLAYFSPSGTALAVSYHKVLKEHGADDAFQVFLDGLLGKEKDWVIKKSMQYEGLVHTTFDQLIAKFKKMHWKQKVRNFKVAITQAKQAQDMQKLNKLLEEFKELQQSMHDNGLA